MLLIDLLKRFQSAEKEERFKELETEVTDEMPHKVADALQEHALLHECRQARKEITYDHGEMAHQLQVTLNGDGESQRGKLTQSQLAVCQANKGAVQNRSPNKRIFIDARGETGKTFLMNR